MMRDGKELGLGMEWRTGRVQKRSEDRYWEGSAGDGKRMDRACSLGRNGDRLEETKRS